MPLYAFRCDHCMTQWDRKLTFAEHNVIKNNIHCETCGEKAYQAVSRLNFTLVGEGWFGKSADGIDSPYTITQNELNKNKEKFKYAEEYADKMMNNDNKIKEL